MEMSKIKTPIISVVIGEGGSGGALALGVADRIYMLEHSVYSVISPEGCAAILWKKTEILLLRSSQSPRMRSKLTAQDLLGFKIIDGIIPEPLGGAHRNPEAVAKNISEIIMQSIEELGSKSGGKLIEERYKRLRRIGSFEAAEA